MQESLKQRINSAKVYHFANPIHRYCQYYPNRKTATAQSDYEFFKPYIRKSRNDQNNDTELNKLTDRELGRMFALFDGNYSIIVPDHLLLPDKVRELDEFFRAQDFVAGPKVDYSTGQYLDFPGDDSLRLDIFGNKVESADWRFFSRNRRYIDGEKIYQRILILDDADEIYDTIFINVFNKQARRIIKDNYEEYGDDSDVNDLIGGDGELDIENGIIFVKDIDDNEEIIDAFFEWKEEYLRHDDYENWQCSENYIFEHVKYNNPINLSSENYA